MAADIPGCGVNILDALPTSDPWSCSSCDYLYIPRVSWASTICAEGTALARTPTCISQLALLSNPNTNSVANAYVNVCTGCLFLNGGTTRVSQAQASLLNIPPDFDWCFAKTHYSTSGLDCSTCPYAFATIDGQDMCSKYDQLGQEVAAENAAKWGTSIRSTVSGVTEVCWAGDPIAKP